MTGVNITGLTLNFGFFICGLLFNLYKLIIKTTTHIRDIIFLFETEKQTIDLKIGLYLVVPLYNINLSKIRKLENFKRVSSEEFTKILKFFHMAGCLLKCEIKSKIIVNKH